MEQKQGRFLMCLIVWVFLVSCSSVGTAGQVALVNKKDGCKFSWPVYDAYEKIEAVWEGPCVAGFAEGEGSIKYSIVYADKTKTDASGKIRMRQGLAHGNVVLQWSDGDSFVGEYTDGERKSGRMRYSDGEIYEGEFKNGLPEGKGTYRWPDGASYVGDFSKGNLEGKGIYRFSDGSNYEGDFLNNKRHGYGTLKDKTGQVVYQGEWVQNIRADDPGGNRSLAGFLEMPWGTSRGVVEETLNNRPGTQCSTAVFSKVCGTGATLPAPMMGRYYRVEGKVNNEAVQIYVWFYEEKLAMGRLLFYYSEQEILNKFDALKNQLIARYGKPSREDGKYLDSHIIWFFSDGNDIQLMIKKSQSNFPGKPFYLRVDYAHRKMVGQIQAKSSAVKNDL